MKRESVGVFKGSPKSWQPLGEVDQKPVEPVLKPVEPVLKPVEPVLKPVEPVLKPVEPVSTRGFSVH
jgi:hypothetical protein